MNITQTVLLSLFLGACSQPAPDENSTNIAESVSSASDPRVDLLRATGDDPWVNWPADERYFGGAETPCVRVSEQALETSIRLLSKERAQAIGRAEYQQLTGQAQPQTGSHPYLLRGFSSSNSEARVTVNGDVVTVHSDALGGIFKPRRHPCVAMLNGAPSTVYTVVAYDL